MLLILVIVAIAYFIWRMRTPADQQKAVERQAEAVIARNTMQVSDSLRRFARRLPWVGVDEKKKHTEQVRTWIHSSSSVDQTSVASNTDFRMLVTWLKAQSDVEFDTFVGHLDAVAGSLGISFDHAFDKDSVPELKTLADQLMQLCALAVWKSYDIKTLVAYQEWSKSPDQYKDEAFADHLYTRLVKLGWIKPDVEVLMQSDKERRQHIISSIRQAANQHGSEFIRILKQGLLEDTLSAVEPPAEMTAKAAKS